MGKTVISKKSKTLLNSSKNISNLLILIKNKKEKSRNNSRTFIGFWKISRIRPPANSDHGQKLIKFHSF